MEHYYALPGHFDAHDQTALGKKDVFKATESKDFHICPDTHGSLLWESGTMEDGRPLLILTTEDVPAEYISYLRDKNISYIATGKSHIDLVDAMETLYSEFGVERLAVLGGGLINGGFLEAGLIDEVSLLLAPRHRRPRRVESNVRRYFRSVQTSDPAEPTGGRTNG